MVQALLEVMPPTATDVTVDDSYMDGDPFATIANAADVELVGVLMEDFDGFIADEGEQLYGATLHDEFDCDLAVNDDGDLVYREDFRQFVGL